MPIALRGRLRQVEVSCAKTRSVTIHSGAGSRKRLAVLSYQVLLRTELEPQICHLPPVRLRIPLSCRSFHPLKQKANLSESLIGLSATAPADQLQEGVRMVYNNQLVFQNTVARLINQRATVL